MKEQLNLKKLRRNKEMIKLICPECGSNEVYLKGDEKSINDKDLFICDCGMKFELVDAEWEQE